MATLQELNTVRRAIADLPQVTFNETTADGSNASWRLTNKPVEKASESVFVSGIIQQTATNIGTTSADVVIGDTSVDFGADIASYSVGDVFALANTPDPTKYYIESITDQIASINREIDANVSSGANIYKIDPIGYSMNYQAGVLYFDIAHLINTPLACNFRYFKYSAEFLTDILDDAIITVGADINDSASFSVAAQKNLILLQVRIMILQAQVAESASSSIKIKQGSTSLDLTGSNRASSDELKAVRRAYEDALRRYLTNQMDDIIGAAVVGREEYIA